MPQAFWLSYGQKKSNALKPEYETRHAAAMFTIEVQAPAQTQAGAVMYPPLVVSSDSDDSYDFIQVALVDPYGRVLVDQLYGTLSTAGKALHDGHASRSSRSKEYSVFPDLSVRYAGVYALQATAIRMDYAAPGGPAAFIAAQTTSRQIIAYDQSVAAEIPCFQPPTNRISCEDYDETADLVFPEHLGSVTNRVDTN
ncbi:hypothetical protein F5Y05DRAFT_407829 [Hypoxylon sp. FL0543]|nr:hypothetical protein F5Y05DRAFT_407829 [Hypoxylon sp. FL0543]